MITDSLCMKPACYLKGVPGVFISYSHDPVEPAHSRRVAGLVASLLRDGLQVFFDQNRNDKEEALPWPVWMEDRIDNADHVLLVCSELYLRKVRQEVSPDQGRGVCWEANLIYNRLYIAKLNTSKFVPVLFSKSDERFVPGPLQGAPFRFVLDSQEGYLALYAFLTGQHRAVFPRRGVRLARLPQEIVKPLFAPVTQVTQNRPHPPPEWGCVANGVRDFLAAKVTAFEQTRTPLASGDLVLLYRHRHQIHPSEPELLIILASLSSSRGTFRNRPCPGWFWFRNSRNDQWWNRFLQVHRWASEANSEIWTSECPLDGLPVDGVHTLLVSLSRDPSPHFRAACANALGKTGRRKSLAILLRLAEDADWTVRLEAIKALGIAKAKNLSLWRRAAKDQNPVVRKEAVESIGRLASEKTLPLLRDLARDENPEVRWAAQRELACVAKPANLKLLLSLAKSAEEDRVQYNAKKSLLRMAQAGNTLLLRELAQDKDPYLRLRAARALANVAASEALPHIQELARDRSLSSSFLHFRRDAIRALACISQNEAIVRWRELVESSERMDREDAVRIVAEVAPDQAVQCWRAFARDSDAHVRYEALRALSGVATPEDVPLLLERAKDDARFVRVEDVSVLAGVARQEALEFLRSMARSQDMERRLEAGQLLAEYAVEEALPLLKELALRGDERIACAAVHSLDRACSRDALEGFLNQHDQELCTAALDELDFLLYMPEWLRQRDDEGRPCRLGCLVMRYEQEAVWDFTSSWALVKQSLGK